MSIKDFNEALYASSNGVIVERRKSITMPILILLVGLIMLVVNYFIPNNSNVENIKSTLVLFGGLTTIVGVLYCAVNIFGEGVPYSKKDGCFLVSYQYTFDRAQCDEVVKAVEKCDKSALDALAESDIASVIVVCYYSPNSNYCTMQAFAYEDYVYQSITKRCEKV